METHQARRGSGIPRAPMLIALVAGIVAVGAGIVLATSGSGSTKALAALGIGKPSVEIQFVGESGFASAANEQPLKEGDTIRTDAQGNARIQYFDGSLTRVGPATTFQLERLSRTSTAGREIRGNLEVGKTWHRVQRVTGSGSRFEVKTSNAVAAVRGTTFGVECLVPKVCEVSVGSGSVVIEGNDGSRTIVEAGHRLLIEDDGNFGPVQEVTPEDAWYVENTGLDRSLAGSSSGEVAAPASSDENADDPAATTTTAASTDNPVAGAAGGTATTTAKGKGATTTGPTATTSTTEKPSTTSTSFTEVTFAPSSSTAPTTSTTQAPTNTTASTTSSTSTSTTVAGNTSTTNGSGGSTSTQPTATTSTTDASTSTTGTTAPPCTSSSTVGGGIFCPAAAKTPGTFPLWLMASLAALSAGLGLGVRRRQRWID